MSCGVGRRLRSDPVLLWLWCRLVATALIRPLAWEPPYAAGAAQEIAKRQKDKKKKKKEMQRQSWEEKEKVALIARQRGDTASKTVPPCLGGVARSLSVKGQGVVSSWTFS